MKPSFERIARVVAAAFVAVCIVLAGIPATAEEQPTYDDLMMEVDVDATPDAAGDQPDGQEQMLDEGLPGEGQPDEELPAQEQDADGQAQSDEAQPSAIVPESMQAVPEGGAAELGVLSAEADDPVTLETEASKPAVRVLSYQGSGWASSWSKDGGVSGQKGKSLSLEALRIRIDNTASGSVRYRTHVQQEGWQDWAADGAVSGSAGKGLRIECIQIKLDGSIAREYDVWYRVYCQRLGWMGWAKNGKTAGTAGKNLRMEAIQVTLRKKGSGAPSAVHQSTKRVFVGAEEVRLAAYVQNLGWLKEVGNGRVAGTTGKGLRVEALRASLNGVRVPGDVKTSVHVKKLGWTSWKGAGAVAGTTGKSLRVEAIKMRLSGEVARVYDLYYRVHVKGLGWLSWAKEGEVAGTVGLSLQVEAVQAKLVRQGAKAPSNGSASWSKPSVGTSSIYYRTYGKGAWSNEVRNGRTSGKTGKRIALQGLRAVIRPNKNGLSGTVRYRAYMQGAGWQSWRKNGKDAGRPGAGKRMEAIQIKIAGRASKVYDVWYRVHVQGFGWLGWTKNGGSAGTVGMSRRIEAVQIKLVPKKYGAPGSTNRAFIDWTLCRALNAARNTRTITAFGGHRSSDGVIRRISNAIADIRNAGYDVGFIMMDISTRKGIAYNCDSLFYSASSIKGPYLASVVSSHPEAISLQEYNITQTLFFSYDETYKAVLAVYGKDPMRTYCREAGVSTNVAESLPWVNYSARDLAKFWARNYLLFSQSAAGEQFGRWCERPNVSTIHTTLSGTYRTRSKAGWTNFGGVCYPNINGGGPLWDVADDGGIVYARNGDYVMAIVSSAVGNHSMLHPLTAAINAAHEEM